jgi:hypothetical protein
MASPDQNISGGGSALGDLFSGIDRPKLNALVSTSQARNGLVSAQTQEAMVKAAQAQEQMKAWDDLESSMLANGAKPSDASLVRTATVAANDHNPETAMKVWGQAQLAFGNQDQQVRGAQAFKGELEKPTPVAANSLGVPGTPGTAGGAAYAGAPLQTTPEAQAQTAGYQALAGLNAHKDATPGDFRNPSILGTTSPDGQAALQKAVAEGRLDPTRLNSRTAPIMAQMALADGTTNFNRLHADASLQANPTFQQKAMSVDMLPGLLTHVTSLGKKLNGGAGYSDLKSVGMMQQWTNGQLNDPDYTEYMTARNDTLLRLAGVMRGVGMSDQAHTAEVEAMAPTLAPYALDAWFKGQMSVVNPLLERQNRITHLGETGQGTRPLGASSADTAAPAKPPLGETVPTGGAGGLPSYPDEASARAAGHRAGDRIQIGGVSGTLN